MAAFPCERKLSAVKSGAEHRVLRVLAQIWLSRAKSISGGALFGVTYSRRRAKKRPAFAGLFNSGGGIRTRDLRV
jgi:hypothetical protein